MQWLAVGDRHILGGLWGRPPSLGSCVRRMQGRLAGCVGCRERGRFEGGHSSSFWGRGPVMGPALTEKRQGAGELGRGQGRGGSGFGPAGSGEQGQAVAGADGLGTEGRMGSGTAARDSQDAGRGSGAGHVWEASSAPKAHPGRAQSGPVRHTDLRSGPRAEPLGRGGLVSGVRARWHVTVRARRVSGVAGRRAGRHP